MSEMGQFRLANTCGFAPECRDADIALVYRNITELEEADRLGCWFSVGPAMLRSAKGRELTSRLPRGRILTESDGPFVKLN